MNEPKSKIRADIAEHGWHVVKVAEDADGPGFAYSIGLYETFRAPEVIMIGLPRDTTHVIINDVGDHHRAGHRYVAGGTYHDFLEGYACTFRTVPRHQYRAYLGFARWYYDGDAYPVLQLVYPDREHRWPWQDGVPVGFRAQQPVLADEPEPP